MNECSEIESILCNTTLNNIDHYDRDYRVIHNPPVLAGDHVTKDVCTQSFKNPSTFESRTLYKGKSEDLFHFW